MVVPTVQWPQPPTHLLLRVLGVYRLICREWGSGGGTRFECGALGLGGCRRPRWPRPPPHGGPRRAGPPARPTISGRDAGPLSGRRAGTGAPERRDGDRRQRTEPPGRSPCLFSSSTTAKCGSTANISNVCARYVGFSAAGLPSRSSECRLCSDVSADSCASVKRLPVGAGGGGRTPAWAASCGAGMHRSGLCAGLPAQSDGS